MENQEFSELREKVALSCRILAQHGLVRGSTGHVSVRIPGTDEILMRGRPKVDKGLRYAEPTSVIRVGSDGNVIGDTGGVARVSEVYIHTEIIKKRPEVNCVIHAHPTGVLLCTMNGVTLRPIFSGYMPGAMRMAAEGVPIYHRSITLQNIEETTPFVEVMGNKNVCLMYGHGIAVAGKTVEEATSRAIGLETLARINWFAALKGHAPEISDEDKQEWARRARVSAERGGGGGDEGRDGGWAYYVNLLDQPGQVDVTGLGFPSI
jgi:ribulose-5-phosphate 4-epimerase/fuculose-1-phosphate aldolase